jgi:hypothetical protein
MPWGTESAILRPSVSWLDVETKHDARAPNAFGTNMDGVFDTVQIRYLPKSILMFVGRSLGIAHD